MKKILLAAAVLAVLLGILYLCMPFVIEDPQPVRIGAAFFAGIFT